MMGWALVARGNGHATLEERPHLQPTEGEMVVYPEAVGICGTDLELIDGQVDTAYARYPLVLGHEWVGRVGDRVAPPFSVGDYVVVEGIVPCWACSNCASGDTHLCTNYEELGFTLDGAAADEVVVKARLAHKLSEAVHPDDAVMVEPSAVVYHGLSRMGLRPGLEYLVVGDGTIGMLALQLLGLWSPARLVMTGRREEQRPLALASGADEFVDGPVNALFDVVVEAAGTPEAVLTALSAARRGASVLLLGLAPEGVTTPVPTATLLNNDLVVRASFGYSSHTWYEVVRLLNAGKLRPRTIVTHRFDLAAHEEAVTLLRTPPPGEARGKVLLQVRPPITAKKTPI